MGMQKYLCHCDCRDAIASNLRLIEFISLSFQPFPHLGTGT
ncbi:MAG: hypothetical protein ACFB02_19570 [Mastigocoleus sp.]